MASPIAGAHRGRRNGCQRQHIRAVASGNFGILAAATVIYAGATISTSLPSGSASVHRP